LHSTLTATRSLLRHYESTGTAALLQAAIERYRLFRNAAMTDNFENHNWFGRPEWTEACAVVDSFMAAVQLWRFTGEPRYLEDAHHIYYNGLCVNQRMNGGFGCDSCPSRNDPFLFIKTQEARWCCTQRGADGLATAARSCFFTDAEGVFAAFYQNARATIRWGRASMVLRETTSYPWEGRVRFEILETSDNEPRVFRLLIPSWAQQPVITVDGHFEEGLVREGFVAIKRQWRAGNRLELAFTQRVMAQPPVNRANGADPGDYHTFHYGPMILGHEGAEKIRLGQGVQFRREGQRDFVAEGSQLTLRPIYHRLDPSVAVEKGYRRQILFE
jgi:uncharacterized protein